MFPVHFSTSSCTSSLILIAQSVERQLRLSVECNRVKCYRWLLPLPPLTEQHCLQWHQQRVWSSCRRHCWHFPATSWHWKPRTSISLIATAEIKSREWFFFDWRFTTCTGAHEGHEFFFFLFHPFSFRSLWNFHETLRQPGSHKHPLALSLLSVATLPGALIPLRKKPLSV